MLTGEAKYTSFPARKLARNHIPSHIMPITVHLSAFFNSIKISVLFCYIVEVVSGHFPPMLLGLASKSIS